MAVRPVAISNSQRMAGILDVDASITDEQIAYQCAMYNLTCDCEALGLDDYGPPDFLPDQRVTTLVELDNYLRTIPYP